MCGLRFQKCQENYLAISPFFLSSIRKTYAIATPITPNTASRMSGVFRIGLKHSYPMFNALITNAAAVMPLNFPPKDRTVIPKINRSSIQSAKLLIWSSKKVGQQTHIRDNMFQPAAQHKKGVENNQAQINDKILPFEIKF